VRINVLMACLLKFAPRGCIICDSGIISPW
jgi:hypothetical protein